MSDTSGLHEDNLQRYVSFIEQEGTLDDKGASLYTRKELRHQQMRLEMVFARALAVLPKVMDAIGVSHDDLALTNLRDQLRRSIYPTKRGSLNIPPLPSMGTYDSRHTREDSSSLE